MYSLHLGMICQIPHHLESVFHMALHPQRQAFQPLQKDKSMKGRKCGPGIPKQDGPDFGHESRRPRRPDKADAVIAGIGLRQRGKAAAGFPVEPAALHNHPAQGSAVPSDELGGGMHHDVRTVLDGTHQIRRCKGIVHCQGNSVGMGDFGQSGYVRHLGVGIAQGLRKQQFCIVPDSRLHLFKIKRIHEGSAHAIGRQGVGQQIVGAAVDVFGRHHMIPRLGQVLDGICDRSRAGTHCQRRRAPFQGRHPPLKHIRRGIGKPAVNIARSTEIEPGRRLVTVPEHIGGSLVNGNCSGVRCRVRLLLSHMKLQSLKF